ncbi:hypothetical protein POVWA2_007460 [Plasmodium ovale wallikeri]|uniref:Uncharacterized protein n=1 Tax=Plasmodium ovale wallikeri TaxID=864142 RepID=A0A1A8YJF5_PLAOA|nr:hypothetical protein POVWA1_007320 [Plasmodium ovale wallikeri]SBT32051.1 hypothetical protein POVWA2_007460 [Plasmodium ovale wallikeri]
MLRQTRERGSLTVANKIKKGKKRKEKREKTTWLLFAPVDVRIERAHSRRKFCVNWELTCEEEKGEHAFYP